MRFQIFRYYLTPSNQKSLFSENQEFKNKETSIVELLKEKIDFESAQSQYAYRFESLEKDHFVFAKIGKQMEKIHSLKVKDAFVEKKEEEWPHRHVIFDTRKDSHLVAFELYKQNEFSSPFFVLNKFSEQLNKKLPDFGWHVEFEPVIDENIFWEVVKKNTGEIKKLKFTYHVPNLFGINNNLESELEGAKQFFTAQKVEASVINEEGNLSIPKNEFVESSISHISHGGGKYEITLKNRDKITNETGIRTERIKEAKINLDNFVEVQEIVSTLFKK